MEIRLATMKEFDGVKALLKANHVDSLSEEEKKERICDDESYR